MLEFVRVERGNIIAVTAKNAFSRRAFNFHAVALDRNAYADEYTSLVHVRRNVLIVSEKWMR